MVCWGDAAVGASAAAGASAGRDAGAVPAGMSCDCNQPAIRTQVGAVGCYHSGGLFVALMAVSGMVSHMQWR